MFYKLDDANLHKKRRLNMARRYIKRGDNILKYKELQYVNIY